MLRWNLSTKVVVAYSGLIALMAGVLTTTLYWQFRTAHQQAMRDRLLDLLSLTAPQVDSDYHSLTLATKDVDRPFYKINLQKLQTVQESSNGVNHIYTLRPQNNGQFKIVLNYAPKSTPLIGQSLATVTPILSTEGFTLSQSKVENSLLKNADNQPVLYGYAPIKDQFGRLEGILAIELDASSIVQTEIIGSAIALGIFLVILGFTVVIVRWLARSLIVNRTLRINHAAKKIAAGEWHQSLSTDSEDELGELAKSFNYMAQQLQNSFQKLEEYSQTLEQKVKERTAELEQAKLIADAANQAKSTFIANMSHELRSPLNAILGFAQIMTRSQALGKENQENVGIIYRSGEHLLTLINNVLDLSKIEAGKTTLNPKNFDLHRLLDDIHDMFQIKAEEKNLQLIMEYEPDVPQYIRTDEVKLRQVLINLINNGLKFTQSGGVSIRVGHQKNTLANEDADTINFEVEDSGAGIAPEELGELFEAFSQTTTGKQAQEGTGLGLPISRQFVSLMGGDIQVKSQVEKGTTFFFDIQVTRVNANEIDTRKPTHRVIALAPNQPTYRLLIVDDKPLNRQLLIKLLSPLGFQLQEASNGQEAINIWETWEPHLIWMDMRMTVMDGYEATQRIKNTTKGQATAVIAVTASVLEEEKAVVLSAGCDDFLRKPFREEEIFQVMHKHLGVNFIYEDLTVIQTTETTTKEILTVEAIAQLPTKLLEQLQEAIITSNLDLIAQVLEQVAIYNAPLSKAIGTCLYNFEYEKILHLIA
ncbi:ATP-binding protein [Calothrix sp. PCC 6303]|uniref:ATP-binding protein n=1 Tax=Calothrix sp. PCC 6303 TaxID=1170562 RepID=UPI0002A01553|nr:ATP-binding protein [Calothrix sp. PCC 6303]AFY99620.1 integral membrane sensor hybrid histidine kinase [Calothrix sp. PCC 6303]